MKLFRLLKFLSLSNSKKIRTADNKIPNEDSFTLKFNDKDMNLETRFISDLSTRFNSLYRQQRINPEESFVFKNVKGFSSIGFRFAIDIVICDKVGEVLATYTNFPPQKLSSFHEKGYYAICLSKGTIKFWNIKPSDILKVQKTNTYW
ncbi:DUF192 domain-containing protein [Spiroplasma alleghenense]|uniref:DUF192 domain-containing protein n=1 Tax=Spiroplasma alleghenense TaxID=216931 RepID=A0A345Z3B6_9MOLU|nr:DUF192 domain-containing protein [Spiroplasma alleghenense]AXK51095.1 hypothetical protein SALLE_v1c04210 [Spiroplasma alleghenense]